MEERERQDIETAEGRPETENVEMSIQSEFTKRKKREAEQEISKST